MTILLGDMIQQAHEIQGSFNDFLGKPKFGATSNSLNGKPMTQYAMRQFFAKENIGVDPDFFVKQPRKWRGQTINNNRTKKEYFVRQYGNTTQAVLDRYYKPFAHHDALETIMECLGSEDYELVRPHMDHEKLFLRVLLSNYKTQHSNFGLGFIVTNGNLGSVGLKVLGFFQRTSCTNSTVLTNTLRMSHRGATKSVRGYKAHIAEAIGVALQHSSSGIDRMIAAQNIPLHAPITEVLQDLQQKGKIQKRWIETILQGTEGQMESLFGLTNGLTYASHAYPMKPEQALALQQTAGQFLHLV